MPSENRTKLLLILWQKQSLCWTGLTWSKNIIVLSIWINTSQRFLAHFFNSNLWKVNQNLRAYNSYFTNTNWINNYNEKLCKNLTYYCIDHTSLYADSIQYNTGWTHGPLICNQVLYKNALPWPFGIKVHNQCKLAFGLIKTFLDNTTKPLS